MDARDEGAAPAAAEESEGERGRTRRVGAQKGASRARASAAAQRDPATGSGNGGSGDGRGTAAAERTGRHGGAARPDPLPLSRFLGALEGRGASAHTVKAYRQDLMQFAAWFRETHGEGWEGVLAASEVDLRLYVRELTARDLAPSSIQRKVTVLSRFLKFASERKMRSQVNPQVPKLPTAQERAPRWLSAQERVAFLRAAGRVASGETRAVISLLLHTGLRAAEVCTLRHGDVKLGRYEGGLVVRGKGNKQRLVPLNPEARAALRELGWSPESPREAPLIESIMGERLTPSGLLRRIRSVGLAAGLRVTPHMLRHTHLKAVVDGGAGLHVAAALAGHASLQTTAGYTTPGAEDLEAAVRDLNLGL